MSADKDHHFIKNFQSGDKIRDVYLLREKTCGLTKKGDFYASLELVDSTGKVDAKLWDTNEAQYKRLVIDRFVEVEGQVDFFKGFPQINISSISSLSENEEQSVDLENYLPSSTRNPDVMYSELQAVISEIKNPFLVKLLKNIFSDANFVKNFKRCPGATDFHHPYLGGLLEHTLNLTKLAKIILGNYPGTVNNDLLITGCILHDIGKTEELTYTRSFNYSDSGKLIGHIVIGVGMIQEKIREIPDFPDDLTILLLHLILSHHGEYEWGSPKRPKCLEAVLLHHLDNVDAKINGFQWFIESYNAGDDSPWTKYSKMFDEYLYKDSRKLGKK